MPEPTIETGMNALGLEMLEILYGMAVLVATAPDTKSAGENMRRLKIIQVLYDDIVIRLCKFTDTDRKSNGGIPLISRLRKSGHVDNARLKAATEALDRLRAVMPKLESYRHTRLAHLTQGAKPTAPHPPLLDAIREAVAFLDALQGGPVKYRVGADDDLRAIVFGEKAST
jgi:hypothetical protein